MFQLEIDQVIQEQDFFLEYTYNEVQSECNTCSLSTVYSGFSALL